MLFIARIPEWFSTRRAAQVVAFFADKAGGRINVLRVSKLIYLADRANMADRDYPVTGDNFVSMDFGPANTFTYSLMNGEVEPRHAQVWAEFIAPRAGYDIPLARPIAIDDLDELSRADIEILEQTWDRFKDIDKYDLAEWTHKYCPEWQDPNGSSVPIDFSTVYKQLEKAEPIELAEQIQAERSLCGELWKVANGVAYRAGGLLMPFNPDFHLFCNLKQLMRQQRMFGFYGYFNLSQEAL